MSTGPRGPAPGPTQGLTDWFVRHEVTRLPQDRWITGVAAGLCQRLNMPLAVLRGCVIVTTVLSVGILAIPYGLAYVVLALTLPEGERIDVQGRALAVDPGLTAPEDPQRPYLKEFLTYFRSGPELPKPVLRLKCHGFVTTGLAWPPNQVTDNLGFYQTRMAYGTVALYPGWLVFLTDARAKPGRIPALREMGWTLFDQFREARRFMSVGSLLHEAYKLATPGRAKDRFDRLLGNPSSLFIPLSSIEKVEQHRYLLFPRMVVTTADREIVFGPNGYFEMGPSFLRVIEGWAARWQPPVSKTLEAAAQRNTSQPVARAPTSQSELLNPPQGALQEGRPQPEGTAHGTVRPH